MAERSAKKKLVKLVYEGAAARYRTLMMKTRDPARRRMLEEMIARELETLKRRDLVRAPMSRKRFGGGEVEIA
jgi:hypothetical protein